MFGPMTVVNSMIANGYTLDEYLERKNLVFTDHERKLVQDAYDSTEAMSQNQVYNVSQLMYATGKDIDNTLVSYGYLATKKDKENITNMYNKLILSWISDWLAMDYSQETIIKQIQQLASKLIIK